MVEAKSRSAALPEMAAFGGTTSSAANAVASKPSRPHQSPINPEN